MGLGRLVELAEQHPGLCPCGMRIGIDFDPVHRPQVDHQAAVADRGAGKAVAAASNRHRQAALPGELQGGGDVGCAAAARDQGG